ncbi:MAG: DNA-binding protein [Paludibacter sp.]|nr:DNA-binding protein [Paludibacter sp.]
MKIKVIIEQNSKGRYSAYIDDDSITFGILGQGNSVNETIEDFKIGIEEMRETYKSVGKDFPELELEFKYDVSSFLSTYSNILTLSGLSRLTGINKGLLSHYATGRKRPRSSTVLKIKKSVHNFGNSLMDVDFV